jgi:sugar/nucleoside kinase (ribokinase family)
MENLKIELIKKLKTAQTKKLKVVVMPHFCIDSFINYNKSFTSLSKNLKKIKNQGGGNIRAGHNMVRGGKAANVAAALSSLGIKTYLISKTNKQGLSLLKEFFKNSLVNLSLIKTDGSLAITTAIELKETNIMISDPGSTVNFGGNIIEPKDEKAIKSSDLVYISDWGLNDKGTELAKKVFTLAKKNNTKTFFDPGDSSSKKNERDEIKKLTKNILNKKLVDFLSVNEGEIKKFGDLNNLKKTTNAQLHTSKYSKIISTNNSSSQVPVFNIKPKRFTGAGDSWNSGNIFGELLDLDNSLKLLLSNAIAAYYMSSPDGNHPTIKELVTFLQKTKLKK